MNSERFDSKCLILFDYDGVLVDSLPYNLKIVAEVLEGLGYREFPTAAYCASAECISFEEWGKRIGMSEAHYKPYLETILQRTTSGAAKLPLFDGVLELLESLRAEHELGVITANTASAATAFLSQHGAAELFSEIVGVDTPGAKSVKILKIAADLRYPLERVYYVGDAGTDVQQGKAAGVKTIGVTWGFQSRERLEQERPDYLVHSPEELANIFLPRNRNRPNAFSES